VLWFGRTVSRLDTVCHFLANTKHRIKIHGSCSEWITSGVPQGSVLGPILFIIFVNDLPDVVSSTLSAFAELYRHIASFKDHLILQRDIDNFLTLNRGWQLFFNYDKCYIVIPQTSTPILRTGAHRVRRTREHVTLHTLNINGEIQTWQIKLL